MKQNEIERMSVDELWELHAKLSEALAKKIAAEKRMLDERLRLLTDRSHIRQQKTSERRSYPRVIARFRNPENPAETWAGRGKQPRWVTRQLSAGKRIDDFR